MHHCPNVLSTPLFFIFFSFFPLAGIDDAVFSTKLLYFSTFQVEGCPERPRMSVFRSNKHLYVQVIDDTKMHTLASASTMQKSVLEVDYTSGPTIVSSEVILKSIYILCSLYVLG